MAAFSSFANYVELTKRPTEVDFDVRSSIATLAGRSYSLWAAGGNESGTGVAPTTAAVPTRTLAGSLSQSNPASGYELFLPRYEPNRVNSGTLILCDRLSHQGGLSGTSAVAQSTNLPTAALTRYTNGEGVMAAIEIYTQIGTTQTTFTVSYTNQANTSGRTSIAAPIGGTNYRTAGRVLLIPPTSGDWGFRAVASVTLAVSTGTAGAFGVTLFKPLMAFPYPINVSQSYVFDALLNMGGQLPEIQSDACLFWMFVANTTASGVHTSNVAFVDR